MYCPNCGHENLETNKFCMSCGTQLPTSGSPDVVPAPTPTPTPRRLNDPRLRWVLYGLGGLIVIVGGFALGIFLIRTVLGLQGSEEILLALPQRDGEYDLALVKLGEPLEEGMPIFEDMRQTSQVYIYHQSDEIRTFLGTQFGGFVPDSRRVLVHYQDDEDAVIRTFQIGDEESMEIFTSDAFPISGIVYESGPIFISESRNNQRRCYVAQDGEDAQRVGRGTVCWAIDSGERVYVSEVDNGETTLSLFDNRGQNEIVVLDEVDDVISYRASPRADVVAYVQARGNAEQQLHLVDVSEGTTTPFGPERFNVHSYGFLPQSSLPYAMSENDEGELELYVGPRAEPVAVALGLEVLLGEDDDYVYYMMGDGEGDRTVYVYDVGRETSTEVLADDDLQFAFLDTASRLLIRQQDDDEITLYSAAEDGGDLVEIFHDDNLNEASVLYVDGSDRLYILAENEDGETSLFTTPLDVAEGYYLLEEWYQISLLNMSPDGRRLVLSAVEDLGDRPILYSLEIAPDADLMELDDDSDSFPNAVFTPNGRQIIYTARTGDDQDDVEVLRIDATGEEPAERLYEEAELADVRWTKLLRPFRAVFFRNVRSSTSFCPGAPSIAVGQTRQGVMDTDGEICYRIRLSAQDDVMFELEGSADQSVRFAMTFHAFEGDQMASSGTRTNPQLYVSPNASGIYFLKVVASVGNQPRYTLRAMPR